MSESRTHAERTAVVDQFTKELKNSGYTRSKAREIVVGGLLGLERKRKRRKREGHKFHRRAKNTLNQRTMKKMNGKQSWYKTKQSDKIEEREKRKENRERTEKKQVEKVQKDENKKRLSDPKAVIFVPYTPNSALAKELRLVEESMESLKGTRIKTVEKAGNQLKRVLVKSNPWSGSDCKRDDCLICQTREEDGEGKGMTCWKRNILYETWCETFKQRDGKRAEEAGKNPEDISLYKYIGESSRRRQALCWLEKDSPAMPEGWTRSRPLPNPARWKHARSC